MTSIPEQLPIEVTCKAETVTPIRNPAARSSNMSMKVPQKKLNSKPSIESPMLININISDLDGPREKRREVPVRGGSPDVVQEASYE